MFTSRRAAAVILGLMVLIIIGMRARTFTEPLDNDITIYAVIGHEMTHGRALYADLWDIKPPAIYTTFSLAERLTGYGAQQIFFLNILAATVSLLGVYAAARAATNSRRCGLVGAAFWVLIGGYVRLEANQPNAEAFINALVIWGVFAILLSWRRHVDKPDSGASWYATEAASLWLAGFCFGLASLYKQVAVVAPFALSLAYVLSSRLRRKGDWSLMAPVSLITPTIFLWLLTCLYFAAVGHFDDFYYVMFVISRIYASQRTAVAPQLWVNLLPPETYLLIPPMLIGIAGAVVSRGQLARWIFLIGYTVATVTAIALPQHFYMHYYQLYLPLTCLWGAIGLHALWHKSQSRRWRTAVSITAVVTVGILGAVQAPYLAMSADQISEVKYTTLFKDTKQIALELNAHLGPNETLYQYGLENAFNFYTGRRPPSGVVVSYPLYVGPKAAEFNQRVIRSLEESKPKLVVINTNHPEVPLWKWLDQHYVRADSKGIFIVLVRRGEKY